jgi:hypothetical protein
MRDHVQRDAMAAGAAAVLLAATVAACGAAASALPRPECSISIGASGGGGNFSVSLDPPYDGSNKEYGHLMQSSALAAVGGQPAELVSLGTGQAFEPTDSGLYAVVATVKPDPGVRLPAATCHNDVYINVAPPPAPVSVGA